MPSSSKKAQHPERAHRCSCGKLLDWPELVLVAIWRLELQPIELKNCPHCRTTLSRVIPPRLRGFSDTMRSLSMDKALAASYPGNVDAATPPSRCESCQNEAQLTLEAFGAEQRWVCHRCAPTRPRRVSQPAEAAPRDVPDDGSK